jgi:hypothetical protein
VREPALRSPAAVKPKSAPVQNFGLQAGLLRLQFERPNHWSLDSFSYRFSKLDRAMAQRHSSAIA